MKVLDVPGGGSSESWGGEPTDRLAERFEALITDMAGVGDRAFVLLAARFEQRLETARLLAVSRRA